MSLTFSSSSSGKLLFSDIGSESIFSKVGPQQQKSVNGSFCSLWCFLQIYIDGLNNYLKTLQLHDINSTRSVGMMLASTSHKDLDHVHLVVLYLLLKIFATDGKLASDEIAMLLCLVVTSILHKAFFKKVYIL